MVMVGRMAGLCMDFYSIYLSRCASERHKACVVARLDLREAGLLGRLARKLAARDGVFPCYGRCLLLPAGHHHPPVDGSGPVRQDLGSAPSSSTRHLHDPSVDLLDGASRRCLTRRGQSRIAAFPASGQSGTVLRNNKYHLDCCYPEAFYVTHI